MSLAAMVGLLPIGAPCVRRRACLERSSSETARVSDAARNASANVGGRAPGSYAIHRGVVEFRCSFSQTYLAHYLRRYGVAWRRAFRTWSTGRFSWEGFGRGAVASIRITR